MAEIKIDPTKDPEFQKVVKHFLESPPKPRKKSEDKKPNKDNKKSKASL